jgi:hypothetical protein
MLQIWVPAICQCEEVAVGSALALPPILASILVKYLYRYLLSVALGTIFDDRLDSGCADNTAISAEWSEFQNGHQACPGAVADRNSDKQNSGTRPRPICREMVRTLRPRHMQLLDEGPAATTAESILKSPVLQYFRF